MDPPGKARLSNEAGEEMEGVGDLDIEN